MTVEISVWGDLPGRGGVDILSDEPSDHHSHQVNVSSPVINRRYMGWYMGWYVRAMVQRKTNPSCLESKGMFDAPRSHEHSRGGN